jgi:Trp operon repressor
MKTSKKHLRTLFSSSDKKEFQQILDLVKSGCKPQEILNMMREDLTLQEIQEIWERVFISSMMTCQKHLNPTEIKIPKWLIKEMRENR